MTEILENAFIGIFVGILVFYFIIRILVKLDLPPKHYHKALSTLIIIFTVLLAALLATWVSIVIYFD